MVALRGNGFISHVGQSEFANNGVLNGSGIGGQRVQVQYVQSPIKHEPPRYSNCVGSPNNYRLLTQSRSECFHTTASSAPGYMPGPQPTLGPQPGLRPQPPPQQPSAAPAAPQPDMTKPVMAGHNYVPQQSPSPQTRAQYSNFPYRSQHATRPNAHPRQQQPYLSGAGNNAAGPVVYHHPTLVFQPHMGLPQGYQQPRSSSSGFYQYVSPYLGYSSATGHTPPYYYPSPNNQQLTTGNVASASPRAGITQVGPQPAPTASPSGLAHAPQPPPHLHPGAMPGQNSRNQLSEWTSCQPASNLRTYEPSNQQTSDRVRPVLTKRSHRVPIIDPVTQQEVLSELYNNDTYYISGEQNERHMQPEPPIHTVAEEFSRLVNESIANQQPLQDAPPPTYGPKPVELSSPPAPVTVLPQTNAVPVINNNNIAKTDIISFNETKIADVVAHTTDTPVVSALSDSPVIVPKTTVNVKPQQKPNELHQSVAVDVDNSLPAYKPQNMPDVSQVDLLEKPVVDGGESLVMIAPTAAAMVNNVDAAELPAPEPVPDSIPSPSAFLASYPPSYPPTYHVPFLNPVPAAVPPAIIEPMAPLPQKIREPRERIRADEKIKMKDYPQQESDSLSKPNGPTSLVSSVDNIQEIIDPATSQENQVITETKAPVYATSSDIEMEALNNNEVLTVSEISSPSATELLSASIEKLAKESTVEPKMMSENTDVSSAIQAQAKLTQSIKSCVRPDNEYIMKDINLNDSLTDSDATNGNVTDAVLAQTETVKEDFNKDDKPIKNSKHSRKSASKMIVNDTNSKDTVSFENGKDETDKVSNEQEKDLSMTEEPMEMSPIVEMTESVPAPAIFTPKYKYSNDQWSPLNKSGKKCYDISLLMQIKDDPLSKRKPSNTNLLEACNVLRSTPHQEPQLFNPITRPINDSLFPNFAKSPGIGSRSNVTRDPKKDGRNIVSSGKGSMKLATSPSGSASHKAVIRVSLTREEVKLNQTKDAWKPTRLKNASVSEEEFKTQELYKKFRGILNKLTPQKFDTLMEKVKTLEINTQNRLEGVIDLVFEKAIDEPNFSEAYAHMCSKLATIKVPADNAPTDQYVNFRPLIISKCQNQFVTHKVDENVLKLEKEMNECTDPVKKKELQVLLEEENRRIRMRSVGNVRFIGELYKLKMLTSKIMVYCMNYLVDKLEEEKLECLCKLLTTIGEQVENEVREQLELVFRKMQDIVEKKSNKISSRVRFMIKDVIELRQRRWVVKSVVDSQPKMMDQIQKEAEQQQRHIELMNSPIGGYGRREDGGRGKRGGDSRRQNNSFMDNNWKTQRTNYTVDTSKLKAGTQKNLCNIILAPRTSLWNYGSGTKNTVQASSNSLIGLTKNKYDMLENSSTDPTLLRANPDFSGRYAKGASIERSTFNSRVDFNTGSSSRPISMSEAAPRAPVKETVAEPVVPAAPPAEPLTETKKKSVKSMIDLSLLNPDNDEVVAEVRQLFPPQCHAAVVTEIVNIVLEKPAKEIETVAKTVLHLVTTNTVSAANFLVGMEEIFECAPDLYIDIPMLYVYLAKFMAPHIEKDHITFDQIFKICEKAIISANHGHLFIKAVINYLKESMGPTFVKNKWQDSGLELKQWMNEDQVPKWIEDNKFEFLLGEKAPEDAEKSTEDTNKPSEVTKKSLTPAEVHTKLLQLMNADETCECVHVWVQDNVGESCSEEWYTRSLMQAVCTHALQGSEGAWHLSRERMHKYARLVHEVAVRSELSCLFAVQRLVHRLEHPQGLTLDIFQYLHEQYIISVDGFIAWETTDKEPEGKAVMLKALTSFFTNIREADNEDSCSEE